MNRASKVAAAVAIAAGLTGCATTEKVATNQLGDENLSCAELKTQNANLDEVAQKASENKGLTKTNVAAAIFFWPAAVGNYMDADTAEKLIDKRRARLAELYSSKHCR